MGEEVWPSTETWHLGVKPHVEARLNQGLVQVELEERRLESVVLCTPEAAH